MTNFYKTAENEIARCVKCGACRSVCPVMLEVGREHGMARGKIALSDMMLRGNAGLTERSIAPIEQCLLCKACTEVCANSVRTDEIMIAMRQLSIEKGKRSPYLLLMDIMSSSWLSGLAAKVSAFLQPLIMKGDASGLRQFRFSAGIFDRERFYPPVAKRAFTDSVPEVTDGRRGENLVFFVGCLNNFLYSEISIATHNILKKTRGTVVVPQKQACCGLPHLSAGDEARARELALRNMSIINSFNPDAIVVSCGSCGSMMKEYYPLLFRDTQDEEMAREFARRIKDISEIIIGHPEINIRRSNGYKSVTFHDPCHLKRGMHVFSEPREIIKIAGYELREMEESDSCCGFGGTFSLKNPEISKGIILKKIAHAEATGAEIIATSCPGCIMQIRDGVKRAGSDKKVKHIVELIA